MKAPQGPTLPMGTLLPMRDGDHGLEHRRNLRPLSDLVLPSDVRSVVDRVLAEHAGYDRIAARGLRPASRLLFIGPPGCGKTVTAGALALALEVPLYSARLDAVIEGYLGATAANLREVFDTAQGQRCVLLLDEIDALGRSRTGTGDDTEMRRVVNSLLVMLEDFPDRSPRSIIVGATNLDQQLDDAIWRRFDEVATFPKPSTSEAAALLQHRLAQWVPGGWTVPRTWHRRLAGLSFADVERLAMDAAKLVALEESLDVATALTLTMNRRRKRT